MVYLIWFGSSVVVFWFVFGVSISVFELCYSDLFGLMRFMWLLVVCVNCGVIYVVGVSVMSVIVVVRLFVSIYGNMVMSCFIYGCIGWFLFVLFIVVIYFWMEGCIMVVRFIWLFFFSVVVCVLLICILNCWCVLLSYWVYVGNDMFFIWICMLLLMICICVFCSL